MENRRYSDLAHSPQRIIKSILGTGFFVIMCAIIAFPVLAGLLASFRPGTELIRRGLAIDLDPRTMTLANYKYLFGGNADSRKYFIFELLLWRPPPLPFGRQSIFRQFVSLAVDRIQPSPVYIIGKCLEMFRFYAKFCQQFCLPSGQVINRGIYPICQQHKDHTVNFTKHLVAVITKPAACPADF